MISKKELLKRVISLEESLGLAYVPGEYERHIEDGFGLIKNIKETIKKENGKK